MKRSGIMKIAILVIVREISESMRIDIIQFHPIMILIGLIREERLIRGEIIADLI